MYVGTRGRLGLLLGIFAVLVLAPSALADDHDVLNTGTTLKGNPTTPSGDIIAPIYEKIIWASIAVFVIVAMLMAYILVRFRHKRGQKPDVPQIHGNSKLEIAWTIGPALVMFWLLVISYNGLLAIDSPDAEAEVFVDVEASRFSWKFTYSDGSTAGQSEWRLPEEDARRFVTLRVEEDTWVQLNVTSVDVIHAISIPGLDVIVDANPGRTNIVSFLAREPGQYWVRCLQFCANPGETADGHGQMWSAVEVFPAGSQPLPYGPVPRAAPATPPAEQPPATDADVIIDVEGFDFGFNPEPFAGIEPGQTVQVRFTNSGPSPHNVYVGSYDRSSNTGTVQCSDPADESTCWATDFSIGTGGSDSFTFMAPNEPIAFDVWCDIPGHAAAGMLSFFSVGGAEPELDGAEPFAPRLPGPSGAMFVVALAGLVLVAARRRI